MTIKLKLTCHSSAAGATGIAGVVMSAPTSGIVGTTRYGEFTGATFESATESGRAVLKVAASAFGGGALTTADTPVALVRSSVATTGFIPCTVIDE